MRKALSDDVLANAIGESERGARRRVPAPRHVIGQERLAKVGIRCADRIAGNAESSSRRAENRETGGNTRGTRVVDRLVAIVPGHHRGGCVQSGTRESGGAGLVDIGDVNLLGERKRLCGLPCEAIVGGKHLPLCGCVARCCRRANHPIQALEILVVVGQIGVRHGEADVAVHGDVLDAGALQAQHLCGCDRACGLRAQIAGNDIARRIDDGQAAGRLRGREDGVGQRAARTAVRSPHAAGDAGGDGVGSRQSVPVAKRDRRAVRLLRLKAVRIQSEVRACLEVRDLLLEADLGLRQGLPVDRAGKIIGAVALVLHGQRIILSHRPGRAECRALEDVLRVSGAERDLRQRQDRQVGVRHPAHGVEHHRRIVIRGPRQRRSGGNAVDQSVGYRLSGVVRGPQQVVVGVLAVAAEDARELVVLALGEVQLGVVVGIAAKARTEGRKRIQQRMLCALHGAHGKGLAQHARPGLDVDQRVVHGSAAGESHHVATQVRRLMDRIPILHRLRRRLGLGRCDSRRQQQHGDSDALRESGRGRARELFRGVQREPVFFRHLKPH